jgi:hypothetical protein
MTRNTAFVLLGVAVLVLKPAYGGPGEELFFAHAGNVSVSFALYFVALMAFARRGVGDVPLARVLAAALTLVAVEAFEIADGFGVMENVWDPYDLLANALGVGLAVLVDVATSRLVASRDTQVEEPQ